MKINNMKKIFVITVLVLFISGCKAEYQVTININESTFFESLKLSDLDNSMNVEEIMTKNIGVQYYENYVMFSSENSPNKKYYNKAFENNEFSLTNSFSIYEYGNSAMIKNCFDNFVISKDYFDHNLKASGFNCFNRYNTLNEVNLKIVIDSAIVSTNLEKLDLNTYSKTITRQNADEEINFVFPQYQVPVNKVIFRGEGDGDGAEEDIPQDEVSSQDGNNPSSQDEVSSQDGNNPSSQNDKQSSQENEISSQDDESSKNDNEDKAKSNILLWVILVITALSTIGIFIFIKNKKNNKI